MNKIFGVYIAPLKNKTAFKIGKSKEPNKRLNQLSRFYDFSEGETIIIQCDDEQQSYRIESCLHEAFEKHNVSMDFDGGTEFFNYTQFPEAVSMASILCKINGLPKIGFCQNQEIKKAEKSEKLAIQIANRIKSKRIEKNLQQKELSKLAKISSSTLQRLEKNGQCNLDALTKIICALKMQDELFKNTFENAGNKRVKKIFVGLSDHESEREGWIYET